MDVGRCAASIVDVRAGYECRYPRRTAWVSVKIAGLPSAACVNLMNAVSDGMACAALAVGGGVSVEGCAIDQRESSGILDPWKTVCWV